MAAAVTSITSLLPWDAFTAIALGPDSMRPEDAKLGM
jgi:hypothetical protein